MHGRIGLKEREGNNSDSAEKIQEGKEMRRILCYGDSNTWGAISGTNDRFRDEERWSGVLQKELGDQYLVLNEGYNGRTTVFDDPVEGRLSGLAYFGPCLETQSPLDLLILMLGTNDLKVRFGVSPLTIASGLERYLQVLQTTHMMGEKPEILLLAPILIDPSYREHALFHEMFGDQADERSRQFFAAYSAFAREHQLHFLDASLYGKADKADGLHMGIDSHKRLGKAVAEKVKEIFMGR